MTNDPSPFLRRHALLALCPFSQPDDIRRLAKSAPAIAVAGLWDDPACLKHLAGEMTEQELLDPTRSIHGSRADARFTVAMMKLSAGNEQAAREQLEKCVQDAAPGYFDYTWARAINSWMTAQGN